MSISKVMSGKLWADQLRPGSPETVTEAWGMGSPRLSRWPELTPRKGGQLGVSWESGPVMCLEGGCRWAANRAPRDAHGLFSMFIGLNKQFCIFIEAEEPLIGCMGAFLAS